MNRQRAFWQSPAGAIVLRPWYDAVGLWAAARIYFPLSRAWAAALAAAGDPHAFRAAVPAATVSRATARTLALLDAAAHDYAAACAAWEDAVFGSDGPVDYDVERRRARAAGALMAGRGRFLGLLASGRLDAVAFDIAPPRAVDAKHGPRLADPAGAFALPATPPAVTESRSVDGPISRVSWVRFDDGCGGEAWARVDRPRSRPARGAVLLSHGIGMETQMWPDQSEPAPEWIDAGYATLQIEGPWHGRRRRPGLFGGEPVLAWGPIGMLDYLHRHALELGCLTRWARAAFGGPIGVAGISLGALTAQIALCAARRWPAEARPDGALLITTAGDMVATALDGAMARAVGAPAAMRRCGWSAADLARWRPLLEPQGLPVMGGNRVVMVLGSADNVTPFAHGVALARAWGVPAANLSVRRQGHFSASLGVMRDTAPLSRLAAVLDACAPARVA